MDPLHDLLYEYAIRCLWLTWAAYWFLSSYGAKTTARHESVVSSAMHLVPQTVAVFLLFAPSSLPWGYLGERMLPSEPATRWLCILVVAAGLTFAVWARVHLGNNWSGRVTIKSDHKLIRSGPYRFARHPIYSGVLLAVAGTAIARGEWRAMLALTILFASLWWKLRFEERWMRETFGEGYAKYQSEVSALIPFVI